MVNAFESFEKKILSLDDFVKWILGYMNDGYYFLGNHSLTVAAVSIAILDKLGINGQDKEIVKYAALLHDIGKLSIPKVILLAPRRLSDKEFEIIKDHPAIGFRKLSHIEALANINPLILYHHYRNGFGYPEDPKMELVPPPDPILTDILTVADAYSAIREKRIYNISNIEHSDAVKILKDENELKNKGINQEIVDVLEKISSLENTLKFEF